MGKDLTVFVGVSGGVDSSVAAALLKTQGFRVIGVFIRTWTPDFIDCTWRDERRDAMRVCAHLGIPFLECDAEEAYKKGVADYMIKEYSLGKTPNPDVMCNREVKFGVFWQFAKEHGADFIATGHYAQNVPAPLTGAVHLLDSLNTKNPQKVLQKLQVFASSPTPVAFQGLCELRTGNDKSKDQSYFLWTLTQEDLVHTLFPVGHLPKTEVRKLALKYKLPTATKKDSQGVCFLGPLDMKDFLRHYIETKPGDVLNEEGSVVGSHDGAILYTLGERHGFKISKNLNNSLPLYVTAKDIINNTITVSSLSVVKSDTMRKIIIGQQMNWIAGQPKIGFNYKAQIRYHGDYFNCQIKNFDDEKVELIFDQNVLVDSGQSIVLYDGSKCIGGLIVNCLPH